MMTLIVLLCIVECEEEREAASHPTIVANSMTFVLLLLVIIL